MLAVALWAASFTGGLVLATQVQRTVLAGAITMTVIYYIDRRAADGERLVSLGLWTGSAVERQRCAMVHNHNDNHGPPVPGPRLDQDGAVHSEAWSATQRNV